MTSGAELGGSGQHRSLTLRLSLALVVVILAVGAAAGTWSYQQALATARDRQDDVLVQTASLAAAAAGSGDVGGPDLQPLSDNASDLDVSSLEQLSLPASTPDGLRDSTVEGVPVRVCVFHRRDGTGLAVTQPVAAREGTARESAVSAVLPLALLLPVLLAATVVAVRRILAPVNRLADLVAQREPDDLRPVDVTRAPRELEVLLDALNTQLARVSEVVETERTFIAHAAHELRTPLTAMLLQLERASAATDPATTRARLHELTGGMQRSRHVVENLLELATARSADSTSPADDAAGPHPTAPVGDLVREAIGLLLPVADEARVEIELEGALDESPLPHPGSVLSILRNLLDNAIRYGPRGGGVVIATERVLHTVVVTIDDEGPGIAEPRLVVEPFYRGGDQDVEGSGLGLAIVTLQLRRVGGTLTLEPSPRTPTGTRARVCLPLA